MLLTISTTHRPATDLGFLLAKHPDRVQAFDVPHGTAHVGYPEAGDARCTAALIVEIDATDGGEFDRSYAASSLLSVAIAKVFRSALRGESRERPDLAASPLPLEIRVPSLRCRGGAALAERLFTPLGWAAAATPVTLDEAHPQWGASRYVDLTLTGSVRLADALNQIYVLLPVLDDAKHYWVAPDEVDKLIRAGTGWLATHPDRGLIVRRYLAHRRSLAASALSQLTPDDEPAVGEEPALRNPSLAEQRRRAVLDALAASGAHRVLDLGCGGGALLADLVRDRRYTEIVGCDVSPRSLEQAARRLRLDRLPQRQRQRIKLWQTALTYRDDRLRDFDAAVLMEVVEHVDPPRLPALADAVFGHAAPSTVVVTTPNVEYNVRYAGLTGLRHADHRFEWTRAEFGSWTSAVAAQFGYTVALSGAGPVDPQLGAPTQVAVFTREGAAA